MRLMLVVAAACNYYTAGSFADEHGAFVGQRATVGCLDVAVQVTSDTHGVAPVVAFAFGNRCAHAVRVDFTSVRVDAVLAGTRRALVAYDPQRVIDAAYLDRWRIGHEMIAYPDEGLSRAICVDVGGLDADRPREERWLCYGA